MKAKIAAAAAAATLTALGAGAVAVAADGGSSSGSSGSRLDDGKQFAAQAKITERQAIAAARTRALGDLGEIDLEHADGRLVFNVDVGAKDVKVDAASGRVLAVDSDD